MVCELHSTHFPIRCTDVIILNELQVITMSASEYLQCSTNWCTSFVSIITCESIVQYICYIYQLSYKQIYITTNQYSGELEVWKQMNTNFYLELEIESSVILACLKAQTISDWTFYISRQVASRERISRLRTIKHITSLRNMFPAPFSQVKLRP
jgi:hypothetical protein